MAEKKMVKIDEKLSVDKFNVNEGAPHAFIDRAYPNREEMERLVRICPAGLYKFDAEGHFRFDYVGCLECGTCRVLSGGKCVTEWHYPEGTFGITYREG